MRGRECFCCGDGTTRRRRKKIEIKAGTISTDFYKIQVKTEKQRNEHEGMSRCKALHERCFHKCKKKTKTKTKSKVYVCSGVVRLVLEYAHECDFIWFKGFFFLNRIHEYLEDCMYDCSLAIRDDFTAALSLCDDGDREFRSDW